MLPAVGRARDDQLLAVAASIGDCATLISRGIRSESSPLGPLTVTSSGSIVTVTPDGKGIGCFPILDMVVSGSIYQTLATTSPPIPSSRASWPVITPWDVEMIAVPIPPWILGMCAWST